MRTSHKVAFIHRRIIQHANRKLPLFTYDDWRSVLFELTFLYSRCTWNWQNSHSALKNMIVNIRFNYVNTVYTNQFLSLAFTFFCEIDIVVNGLLSVQWCSNHSRESQQGHYMSQGSTNVACHVFKRWLRWRIGNIETPATTYQLFLTSCCHMIALDLMQAPIGSIIDSEKVSLFLFSIWQSPIWEYSSSNLWKYFWNKI